MSTEWGVEGYCKQNLLTEYAHLLPEETEARVIKTQLFRIKTAVIDTAAMTVQVDAEHVSYDLRGNIVKEVSISGASPATAVYKVVSGLMMELKGTVATNLTAADNGTYTGTFRGKNGIFCLLDPDNGLAGAFDAAVKRDNWDIFLLQKTHPDRGFRLRYRKNVRGINWNRDAGSLITRVMPVAKDSDGSELYLDSPFIDSPYIETYPVIRIEKLQVSGQVGKDDGTGAGTTWTKAGLQAEMQNKAEERFSVDQVDRVAEEITIDFTQLGDTIDEPELHQLEKALLYDRVRAIDERVGMVRDLDVAELEWDFINQRLVGLVLSNVSIYGGKATVSGYSVQNSSITMEKLDASVLSGIYSAQSKMEQWLLSLQNDDGTIRTNISITESGIRADMADDKAGLQSSIEATASQLRTEYQTADSVLQSSITQTAEQISAEVSDSYNNLYAALMIESSQIRSMITNADGNRVFTSLRDPSTMVGNTMREGDLWVINPSGNEDGATTWGDLADTEWSEISEYDWKNMLGATIYVWKDGKWQLLDDYGEASYQWTNIEQTNERISLTARKVQNVEGQFGLLSAELNVRADIIEANVQNSVTGLESRITQTASQIRAEVSDVRNGLQSSITQTASQIRMEVSDTKNNLQSSITQTASQIRAEVSNSVNGLQSSITQTASQIRSEVSNVNNNMQSSITQTASQIRSEVSDTKNNLQSSITQNANNINLKVDKDGVIAAINISSESVDISASRINLSGYVTASDLQATNASISNLMSGNSTASKLVTDDLRLPDAFYYHGHRYTEFYSNTEGKYLLGRS